MKKSSLAVILLILPLIGLGCVGTGCAGNDQIDDGLDLTNIPKVVMPRGHVVEETPSIKVYSSGDLVVGNTLYKHHPIQISQCPDSFPPVRLEVEPRPATDGPIIFTSANVPNWLDVPEQVEAGKEFEIKFTCGVPGMKRHLESATVEFTAPGEFWDNGKESDRELEMADEIANTDDVKNEGKLLLEVQVDVGPPDAFTEEEYRQMNIDLSQFME